MFSDNYIVYDKFSLFDKKYISTSDVMPWKYTSLYDESYMPQIDEKVADKLNLFFRYRYVHSIENLYDEFKNLIIEHDGENILEYKIYNMMKYATVNGHRSFWKHFISSIDCPGLDLCQSKIDLMTDETDELATDITQINYTTDGEFKSVVIHDSKYNLINYDDNSGLSLVNELCKNDPGNFKGLITLYPNSDNIVFDLMLNYAPYTIIPYLPVGKKRYEAGIVNQPNSFHNTKFKKILLEKEILTQEHIDYIDTIITENSRFDLRFEIDQNGTFNDIQLIHYRVYEFKDLTEG